MELRKIDFEDIGQLFIGSAIMSVPIAFTEEAWNLSKSLPAINIAFIVLLTLSFLCIYIYQSIFQKQIKPRKIAFILRILIDYLIAIIVVVIVLLALNKLPILSEPLITIKRILIISLPASMGAVVVDGFDKE